ncbi:CAP-Gly domain-containing linker protein 1-like isoform X2 [Hyperolius riggenbachi]|uniref:CAP-Gly domain-containing linker protein 1-like isoform X2 n=1 Tax=Hyperolius riggenbachi TaxID=752182 RepID=UPI0035A283FB
MIFSEQKIMEEELKIKRVKYVHEKCHTTCLENDIILLQSKLEGYQHQQQTEVAALKFAMENSEKEFMSDMEEAYNDLRESEIKISILNKMISSFWQENKELNLKTENVTDMDNHDRKKKVAPRLYCDNCEEFDKHGTDDCIIHAVLPVSLPHSLYHGRRKEKRPYCDACERFGHWTLNCPNGDSY